MHVDPEIRPVSKDHLPSFLRKAFEVYEGSLGGKRVVFAANRDAESVSATEIKKQLQALEGQYRKRALFVSMTMSALRRNRLVEQGVPFIVPGKQMYVPSLLLDLRESFRKSDPLAKRSESLSPIAQAILFHHLLAPTVEGRTSAYCARKLKISTMSALRGFHELERFELGEIRKSGRLDAILFEQDLAKLFQSAKPLLRSPVRGTKYIFGTSADYKVKFGGESALSRLTNLGPPKLPVYAIAATKWKQVASNYGWAEVSPGDAAFIVETWWYDPASLSSDADVDRLSLYAQFAGNSDDRVAKSADELLEGFHWWKA
ncbi:MAG TPA: hypothetical protein VF194_02340 [Ferrovibrio sp.]|uniref:hypothetical protein n=1 Tax=Ferrovibrio sp. TaxID=1917215 RepID=UPI002ED0E159